MLHSLCRHGDNHFLWMCPKFDNLSETMLPTLDIDIAVPDHISRSPRMKQHYDQFQGTPAEVMLMTDRSMHLGRSN